MLQHKFNCTMVKQLEEDVTLLIDELVMGFVHAKLVPALAKLVKDIDITANVETLARRLSEAVFPNSEQNGSIDWQCHKRLLPSAAVEDTADTAVPSFVIPLPEGNGLSSDKLKALN